MVQKSDIVSMENRPAAVPWLDTQIKRKKWNKFNLLFILEFFCHLFTLFSHRKLYKQVLGWSHKIY